jgi:hypothetical protein
MTRSWAISAAISGAKPEYRGRRRRSNGLQAAAGGGRVSFRSQPIENVVKDKAAKRFHVL